VVLLFCLAAALLFLGIGAFVTPDTWLALAAGRVVAHGGPPSSDTLTAWTLGDHWVDQQWLGQLTLYGLWRVGGLTLVGVAHALTVLGTFTALLVLARRRGGSSRHVALVGLLALLPIGLVAGNIRTQTFALPLFAAVLWLLSADSRRPSARVFAVVPLLVVWANVHGSVVLGVGLVAVYALGRLLAPATTMDDLRPRRQALALAGLAVGALLVTPYGIGIVGYLHDLLGNPEIKRIAPEWRPVALEPVQAPFFVLATMVVAGAFRERTLLTGFERLALALLLLGALTATRNLAWFGIAALLLLPPLLTAHRPDSGRPPPVALATVMSMAAVLGLIVAVAHGVAGVDRQVDRRYPPAAARVIESAARNRSVGLFVHARYADWLLATNPGLAGRVPFDIRYELLSPTQLRRFRRVRDQIGAGWLAAAGGARLVVLDSSEKPLHGLPATSSVLLRERGARQLYGDHDVAVILRARPARRVR
jgi:hypothetical protein